MQAPKMTKPEDYEGPIVPSEGLKEVFVAYFKSPSDFYCQLAADSDKLWLMMAKISNMYSKLKPDEMRIVKVRDGMPCCALYEGDCTWYRGKILSSRSAASYEVLFVDYGNKEFVSSQKVKELHSDFLSLSPQALNCCLFNNVSDNGQWSGEDIKAFSEMTSEKSFIAQFVKTAPDGTCLISLLPFNKLKDDVLNNQFVQLGHGHLEDSRKVLAMESFTFVASTGIEFSDIEPTVGSSEDVAVTFWHTSLNVFCQLESQSKHFFKIMTDIQKYYSSSQAKKCLVYRSVIGMSCVAQSSADNIWYRARVLDMKQNTVKVYYIDYGHEESVQKKSIRLIPQQFIALPSQAIRCCMPSLANSGISQIPKSSSIFEGNVRCKFISKERNAYIVELTKEGKDIAYELLKMHGLVSEEPAKSLKIERFDISTLQKSQLITVVVSYIQNPSIFWCQLADKSDLLNDIRNKIVAYVTSSPPPTRNLSNELSCIAKYSEDNSWYRAVIKGSKGPNQKEVLFVDYGNVEIVYQSEIIGIKEDLAVLPAQAFQCRLFNAHKTVSQELSQIKQLVCVDEATVKVEKIINDIVFVSLLIEPDIEVNVLDAVFGEVLLPAEDEIRFLPPVIPTDGIIYPVTILTSVDPNNFHLLLASQMTELQLFATSFHEKYKASVKALDNVAPEVVCCAKFSEDDAWYRAQITRVTGEEVTVYFLDYGNYDTVKKGSLKQIEVEDLEKAPFAIPACISNAVAVGGKWNKVAIAIMDNLVGDQSLTVCFATRSSNALPPYSVDLKKMNESQEKQDILELLVEKGLSEREQVKSPCVAAVGSAKQAEMFLVETSNFFSKIVAKFSYFRSDVD